jgi:hypothetical protein
MHTTAPDQAIATALAAIEGADKLCGTTKVVAIDGPSGSGKTDFAAALATRLPGTQILHMDDLYPGWDGLAQAVTDLHDHVLAPLASGGQPAYRRWDWEHSRYAEWHHLPPTRLLLVEGVGSGAQPGWRLVSTLIWLEAGRAERFRRAIERDGAAYLPHWKRWAGREEALYEADGTRGRANVIIDTASRPHLDP